MTPIRGREVGAGWKRRGLAKGSDRRRPQGSRRPGPRRLAEACRRAHVIGGKLDRTSPAQGPGDRHLEHGTKRCPCGNRPKVDEYRAAQATRQRKDGPGGAEDQGARPTCMRHQVKKARRADRLREILGGVATNHGARLDRKNRRCLVEAVLFPRRENLQRRPRSHFRRARTARPRAGERQAKGGALCERARERPDITPELGGPPQRARSENLFTEGGKAAGEPQGRRRPTRWQGFKGPRRTPFFSGRNAAKGAERRAAREFRGGTGADRQGGVASAESRKRSTTSRP